MIKWCFSEMRQQISVDEPTQHDEDGSNMIACIMRKYNLCHASNVKLIHPYSWRHDIIAENNCYSPRYFPRGRRTQEKSYFFLYLQCCVLKEPTIPWTNRNFSKTSPWGNIVQLHVLYQTAIFETKVGLLQQTKQ